MARRIEKISIKSDKTKVRLPRLGINDKCVFFFVIQKLKFSSMTKLRYPTSPKARSIYLSKLHPT